MKQCIWVFTYLFRLVHEYTVSCVKPIMKHRVIMLILYCLILGQVITESMDEGEVKEYLRKKKQEEEELLKNTQESDKEENTYESSTSTVDSDDYEVTCK